MRLRPNEDPSGPEYFRAGETAQPGRYQRLDTRIIIVLKYPDILPASLDGHAAHYKRIGTPTDTRSKIELSTDDESEEKKDD